MLAPLEKTLDAKNYIVSYIDILGTSDAIKRDSEQYLNLFYNLYREAIGILNAFSDNKAIKPKVKVYSDNIVIAFPLPENLKTKNSKIVNITELIFILSAIIQLLFLSNGFASRGCITFGDFFLDSLLVWGNALVEANRIQENDAIYPRVIVTRKFLDLVGGTEVYLLKHVKQDFDGYHIVDYFSDFSFLKKDTIDDFLINIHEVIKKNLTLYRDAEHILCKWQWLANKFGLTDHET